MREFEVEKFGMFFGTHLDDARLSEKMERNIGHDILKQERPLFRTKWFDYRFMHPALATFLFADTFNTVFKEKIRKHVDRDKAVGARAFKQGDIFKLPGRELTGLWRARQYADALGIPYEVFIDYGMERLLRTRRSFMPRPAMLYNSTVLDGLQDDWAEMSRYKLYFGKDRRYRTDLFDYTPTQRAHVAWLFEQVDSRPNKAGILSELLKAGVLSEASVESRYGAATLAHAKE